MRESLSDTHRSMDARRIELLRTASPARKMEMLGALNAAARNLALTGLRLRHPHAGEAELPRRLADLLLGEGLARKVYRDLERAA